MKNHPATLAGYGWRRKTVITALCFLAISLSGCRPTVKNTGWFHENAELTEIIESGIAPPEYNYYYNGPEAKPFVILGIRRDYQFEQGLW